MIFWVKLVLHLQWVKRHGERKKKEFKGWWALLGGICGPLVHYSSLINWSKNVVCLSETFTAITQSCVGNSVVQIVNWIVWCSQFEIDKRVQFSIHISTIIDSESIYVSFCVCQNRINWSVNNDINTKRLMVFAHLQCRYSRPTFCNLLCSTIKVLLRWP